MTASASASRSSAPSTVCTAWSTHSRSDGRLHRPLSICVSALTSVSIYLSAELRDLVFADDVWDDLGITITATLPMDHYLEQVARRILAYPDPWER